MLCEATNIVLIKLFTNVQYKMAYVKEALNKVDLHISN